MEPSSYFIALTIVLAIVVFAFAALQFIWKGKAVDAVSEFTRRR